MKLTLSTPVQFGTTTITELEFQPMKGKHMRTLPLEPTIDDMMRIAGELCAQPPSLMDELSAEDTVRVLEVVGNFMKRGPKIGRKS